MALKGYIARYFTGKVCVITGAASGIGKALALLLSEIPQLCLVMVDKDPSALEATRKELPAHPDKLSVQVVDVTEHGQVDQLFLKVDQAFGRIDVLINCVGRGIAGDFAHIGISHWDQVIRTNFYSMLYCSHSAYKRMLEQDAGQIINLASCAAMVPAPGVPYSTTKTAVLAFSHALRIEGAVHNIRVNAVCPWFVDTAYFHNRIQTGNADNASYRNQRRIKKISARECARRILRGAAKNRATIIPSFAAKCLSLFYRFFPGLFFYTWCRIYKPGNTQTIQPKAQGSVSFK